MVPMRPTRPCALLALRGYIYRYTCRHGHIHRCTHKTRWLLTYVVNVYELMRIHLSAPRYVYVVLCILTGVGAGAGVDVVQDAPLHCMHVLMVMHVHASVGSCSRACPGLCLYIHRCVFRMHMGTYMHAHTHDINMHVNHGPSQRYRLGRPLRPLRWASLWELAMRWSVVVQARRG